MQKNIDLIDLKLDLDKNQIGDNGMKFLGDRLKNLTLITILYLRLDNN